jgi:hypothetical protein
MNTNVAIQLVEIALSLVKDQKGAAVADVLVQIIGRAVQAYQQNTGLPLDPMLIKAEEPI